MAEYTNNVYVMLLPTRLESNWFQDLLWIDPDTNIYIIKGRLRFYNPDTNTDNNPHHIGSMLCVGSHRDTVKEMMQLEESIPGIFLEDRFLE